MAIDNFVENLKDAFWNDHVKHVLALSAIAVVPISIVAGLAAKPQYRDVKCEVQYRDGNEFRCKTPYGHKSVYIEGNGAQDFMNSVPRHGQFTYKMLYPHTLNDTHKITRKSVVSINGKKLPR